MDTLVLVQSTPEAQGDVPPRPNKYLFDEFAGLEGERRLGAILRKILPIALKRTWDVFDDAQIAGNDCYLGLTKAAKAAERVQKTIRQDILTFQARKLLVLRPEEKLLRKTDGTYQRKHVLVKDFSGLYRLAHEYYCWTHSEDYIEPDRDFVELIRQDEQLVKKLRRFNNYRRILTNQTPGPKAQDREEDHWFSDFEDTLPPSQKDVKAAGMEKTDPICTEYLPEQFPEQFPEHSADRIESNDQIESPKGDSNSTGSAETEKGRDLGFSSPTYSHIERGTIRTDRNGTKQLNEIEHRTSNSSVLSEEMAASADAAKDVTGNNGEQSITKEVVIVAPTAPLSRSSDLVEARTLPTYLEGNYLIPISKEFHDKAQRSSATRLAKSYWRLHAYGMDEFAFAQLLDRPAKKTRQKLRYDHVPNPIGYFFTVLENDISTLCKAWDEELHQRALENAQTSSPAGHISSPAPETFDLPSRVQGMASQEEAEALIERIQQEIGTIADMRLWDASIRACLEVYLVDLDLEYSPEASIVHRWSETFATPAEWAAYYAEQTHGRVQS